MGKPVVIRPWLGVALFAVVVVVCLLAGAPLAASGRWGVLAAIAPVPLAMLGVGYVVLLAPAVVFDERVVELRNPLRTVRIPYDRVQSSSTRRGFTVITADGRFSAWAAPPPDRLGAERMGEGRDRRLRDPRVQRDADGGLRASAAPGSPSGDAAITLADRLRQAERSAAHGSGASTVPDARVERRWNVANLAVLAVTLAAAIALAVATAS